MWYLQSLLSNASNEEVNNILEQLKKIMINTLSWVLTEEFL